jgi:hypothetical protein
VANNPRLNGAEAVSLAIRAEGARITQVRNGNTVARLVAEAGDDLVVAPFLEVVDPTLDTGAGPQGEGAVAALLLVPSTLPVSGVARLLVLTVEAVVPPGGLGPLGLSFADGLIGSGQPVRNLVSLEGIAHTPLFGGCEPFFPDCNDNGVPDGQDIEGGASADCDGNSVPDECDSQCPENDCNEDRIPDRCEIAADASRTATETASSTSAM